MTALVLIAATWAYIGINMLIVKWVRSDQKLITTFIEMQWYDVVLSVLFMLPIFIGMLVWYSLIHYLKKLKR